MSPELNAQGDDGQQVEALRAAGERRSQPGGGEHQAKRGSCQRQGQDPDVRIIFITTGRKNGDYDPLYSTFITK